MQLIPVQSPVSFRISSLIPTDRELTRTQQAAAQILKSFDGVWHTFPIGAQDFLLRFFRSFGVPIDYPTLPFWVERAARHLLMVIYPTLRNADLSNPTTEDCGRVIGHLFAVVLRAKEGGAIFQRFPPATVAEFRAFLLPLEEPIRVIIDEGLRVPSGEAERFLRGMNHAFGKTFDAVGFPRGWNTNSPVQLGICLLWRYIAVKSPSLPTLHARLGEILGKQIVGDEDRVKKICHRLGLRFSGSRSVDSQGTAVVLDVPSEVKMISDK